MQQTNAQHILMTLKTPLNKQTKNNNHEPINQETDDIEETNKPTKQETITPEETVELMRLLKCICSFGSTYRSVCFPYRRSCNGFVKDKHDALT
jgi:hypothetical protein